MRKFVKEENGSMVLDASFDNKESAYRALAEFIEENNLSCPDGDDDALYIDMIERVEDYGYHDHIEYYYLVNKKFDTCLDKSNYEWYAETITSIDDFEGLPLYQFVEAGGTSTGLVKFDLYHYESGKYYNIVTLGVSGYKDSGYQISVSYGSAKEAFRSKYKSCNIVKIGDVERLRELK